MHELGVALELVDALTARAAGARVRRVVLEVSVLSSVLPDALAFCFELATEGTPVEGARLELRTVAAHARCRCCGLALRAERASTRCTCGAYDLEWLSGDALQIVEMEVA
jgi:hydrogenase nickel incorporation protein HypA/HybF